jgi:HK97 family phage portal protein
MAWYNNLFKRADREDLEKLNPAQPYIGTTTESSRESTISYERAYEQLEVVNRGVNLIVDDCAEIDVIIGHQILGINNIVKGIKKSRVSILLNTEPNPFQDISTFRRNIYTDYLLDGNIFIYYDGVHLYHLPASKMTIETDPKTYIKGYMFDGGINFKPNEIIHIKENSFYSIYRGVSRLKPATRTMNLLLTMRKFQDNFFSNGAVPGLVLRSPDTLSEKIKERMIQSWVGRYRPDTGGRRPMVLDGGIEIASISNVNFKELDFQSAIIENEKVVLKTLGVPPLMLDSGNNANIRPNMRMYYLETILPIIKKVNTAYERFFGFKLIEELSDISALQPELRDQAAYFSALVNTGIITPNEARVSLNYEAIPGHDDLRVPANIAGSAVNPSEGGRPSDTNNGDEGDADMSPRS